MTWTYRAIVGAALAAGAAGSAVRVEGQSAPVTMAEAVRGGWVADVEGIRHIFALKVRDAAVSGIYCAADCSDPSNLAFVDRGTVTADGVRFQVIRIEDGRASRTNVEGRIADPIAGRITGRITDNRLLLTLEPAAGRATRPMQLHLRRDPRRPEPVTVEELFARRGVESGPLVISGSPTPYTPPGPNEPLSAAVLGGLWVWSTGPDKQHFIFRQVGDRILGVVCGPCDNPYTFGPVDNAVIRGNTFTFDIVHEDWGIGIEFGPYANHATATLSHHELHVRTVQQNGPRTIEGDLVLTGPIRMTPR